MKSVTSISKVISLSLVFSLLLMTFSVASNSKVSAASVQAYNYEDVEELANLLEVVFEEGILYDHSGKAIGFDEKLLKEKLSANEYSYLVNEFDKQGLLVDSSSKDREISDSFVKNEIMPLSFNSAKRDRFLNNCVKNKLNDSYGVAAATAIVEAIKNKKYWKAAKKLIKMGVKAAPPAIVANLGWILFSCIRSADKKGL